MTDKKIFTASNRGHGIKRPKQKKNKTKPDGKMVIQLYNTIGPTEGKKKKIRITLPEDTSIRVLKEKIAKYYGNISVDEFELTYIGTGKDIKYMKMERPEVDKMKKHVKKLERVKTGDKVLDDELPRGDYKPEKDTHQPSHATGHDKKIMTANQREPSIHAKRPVKNSGKIVINLKNTVGPGEGKKDSLRITLPEDTPIKVIKEKIAEYYEIDVDDFELAHMGKD